MDRAANPLRNLALVCIAGFCFLILGYFYVYSFSLGYRMVTVVHGGVLFFLGCVLFIRHLQAFLLFSMIFCISLQFGYHVIHNPLQDIESQPFMSGIAIDSVDVILIVLYMHWGLRVASRRTPLNISLGNPLGTMLLIWIGYCLVASLLKSRNIYFSIYEIVALFKGFLIYFYLINNVVTERDLKLVIYALFATTMAHAVYIVLQYVTGLNYTLHGDFQSYVGPEGFRSIGFFGSPDAAATLMSLILPLGLSYYFLERRTGWRMLMAICMIIVLAAIMCTKVRAAGLAVAISVTAVVIITYLKGRISAAEVFKPVLGAFLLVIIIAPLVIHRFEVGTYGEARLPLVETAWEMFKANWLLGVGANNYFFHIMDYVPPRLRQSWFYIVHNEYLLRLAETGLMGAIFYYGLTLLIFTRLFRSLRSSDPWIFSVATGVLAALIGSLPHRLFSYYHYVNLFLMLSVLIATTHILTKLDRERSEEEDSESTSPEPADSG